MTHKYPLFLPFSTCSLQIFMSLYARVPALKALKKVCFERHVLPFQSYFLIRFSAASTLQKSAGNSWLYFT
jgi:hypothetical protein